MPVFSIHRYRSASRLLALLCSTALTGVVLSVASATPAKAQQVWVGTNPGDDFNSGTNWDTGTVPGWGNTAAFRDNGAATDLSTSLNTHVGALQFDAGAPSYTITLGDDFAFNGSGPGIINNSGGEQTIVADGHVLFFLDGTTAGSATLRTVNGGSIYFRGTSDGGTSTIDLEDGLLLVQLASGGLEIGALQGSGRVMFGLDATDQYLTVGNLNTDTTFAGRISASTNVTGSLIKVGTGTLTLSGNNDYSGGTTVSAGTIRAASDNALGSGLVTLGGGTLALTGAHTLGNDIDLAAAGAIRFDAGANGTLNGSITTNGQGLTLNTLGTGTINGDINGSTSFISKSGSGTLTINGVVSGTGAGIMAGSGTLVLNNANTFGGGSGSTLIGNATLVVGHDHALSTSRLSTNSAGSVLSANKDVSLANNVSLIGGFGLTIDTAGHAIDMSGVFQTIGGSAPITKTGAGTLTLSGDNSGFTGDAVVSEGTLGITGQLGSNAGTVDYTGADSAATATVAVAGTGSAWILDGILSVGDSGTGRLDITDRGTVTNHQGVIGYHEGSTGRATVTGPGSVWTIETALQIGRSGAGDLVVSDGGTIVSYSPWGDAIASNRGSVGTVRIEGPGSSWNGTLLHVAGQGAGTLTLADGGAIYLANDVWIATYASANGTLNIGGGKGEAAAAAGILETSSVNFGDGIASLVFNHTETNYVFSTGLQSTGTGTHALDHIAGTTSVTADNSGFSGTTTVAGGTLLVDYRLGGTALVKDGGTLIVGGDGHADAVFAGDVSVDTGGTLGGVGTIDGNATVAGIIAPGNSIGTLTIDGDYTGDGGLLEIETVLGDDTSDTDLLVINGNTAGTGNIRVTNVGGAGAQTNKGIKIVDVLGAVSDAQFILLGDYVFEGDQAVVAGAYAYRLYQGSASNPDDGDWYLCSALDPALAPQNPGPNPDPVYQAGVPIYEAYAGAMRGFMDLGTLQQRTGNRSWSLLGQGADTVSREVWLSPAVGLWAEIQALGGSFEPETSTTGADYDLSTWRFKAGLDMPITQTLDGTLIGGINVHYGTLSADVTSIFGSGSIDASGAGVGGTLTWFGNNGFYVDGQGQVTWFDGELYSSTAGVGLIDGNDGLGYALSLETGKQIPLTAFWSTTPQAQITYSSVKFDGFTDVFGTSVSGGSSDSLIGRLGITLDKQTEWQGSNGGTNRSHLYGIANLYYDFDGGSNVDVAGVAIESENDAFWGGLGLGGSVSFADDKYSIYGEALAKTSLKNFGDSHTIKGTFGFRMAW